jgi:hypothetical protein
MRTAWPGSLAAGRVVGGCTGPLPPPLFRPLVVRLPREAEIVGVAAFGIGEGIAGGIDLSQQPVEVFLVRGREVRVPVGM